MKKLNNEALVKNDSEHPLYPFTQGMFAMNLVKFYQEIQISQNEFSPKITKMIAVEMGNTTLFKNCVT